MIAGGNHTKAISWQGCRVRANSSTYLQRAALTQRERSGSPLEGDADYRTEGFCLWRIDHKTNRLGSPLISLSRTIDYQNQILRPGSDSFPSGEAFRGSNPVIALKSSFADES